MWLRDGLGRFGRGAGQDVGKRFDTYASMTLIQRSGSFSGVPVRSSEALPCLGVTVMPCLQVASMVTCNRKAGCDCRGRWCTVGDEMRAG